MPESARAVATGKIHYVSHDFIGRGELRCPATVIHFASYLELQRLAKREPKPPQAYIRRGQQRPAAPPAPDTEADRELRALFSDDDDPPAAQHPSEPSAPPPDDSADDLWREQPVLLHDKLWSWSENGEGVLCVLLPVFDDAGKVFDALAWRKEFPGEWYRQTALCSHLGEKALRDCQWGPSPRIIRLYENPAAWLAAPPPALCIVDWSVDLRALFGRVEQIHCTTAKLAEKLEKQFAAQVKHGYSIRVRPQR